MSNIGELDINVICGWFFSKPGKREKIDPFIRVKIGLNHYKTTPAIETGKTHTWNHGFICSIKGENSIEFEAWNEDEDKKSNDILGKTTVSLAQVFAKGQITTKYPVFDEGRNETGILVVELGFKRHGEKPNAFLRKRDCGQARGHLGWLFCTNL